MEGIYIMFKKIQNFISDDQELSAQMIRFLSIMFLIIAGSMSFGEYTKIRKILWDVELTFRPDLISTILALFFVSPLYLRNILKWTKSTYGIVSSILILFVFSSFITLAMGGNGWKGEVIQYGILLCLVLSWLGMRAIAGMCWMALITLGVSSFIINNMTMGVYGFIYICFGFLGLVLHTNLNPGALFIEIKSEFKGFSEPVVSYAKEDMKVAGDAIKQYAKTA